MEAEKSGLTEKLATLKQDLATADMELERVKREAHSKQQQDKVQHLSSFSVYLTEHTLTRVCLRMH